MADEDARARQALDALSRAYEEAAAAIGAVEDPELAFELATELTEVLRVATNNAAEFRVETVGRIWSSNELSLAGLAKRIGVSKARAEQLVKSVKKAKETNDG